MGRDAPRWYLPVRFCPCNMFYAWHMHGGGDPVARPCCLSGATVNSRSGSGLSDTLHQTILAETDMTRDGNNHTRSAVRLLTRESFAWTHPRMHWGTGNH